MEIKAYPYDVLIDADNGNKKNILIPKEYIVYNIFGDKKALWERETFPIGIDKIYCENNDIRLADLENETKKYLFVEKEKYTDIISELKLEEYPKDFKKLIYKNIKELI